MSTPRDPNLVLLRHDELDRQVTVDRESAPNYARTGWYEIPFPDDPDTPPAPSIGDLLADDHLAELLAERGAQVRVIGGHHVVVLGLPAPPPPPPPTTPDIGDPAVVDDQED